MLLSPPLSLLSCPHSLFPPSPLSSPHPPPHHTHRVGRRKLCEADQDSIREQVSRTLGDEETLGNRGDDPSEKRGGGEYGKGTMVRPDADQAILSKELGEEMRALCTEVGPLPRSKVDLAREVFRHDEVVDDDRCGLPRVESCVSVETVGSSAEGQTHNPNASSCKLRDKHVPSTEAKKMSCLVVVYERDALRDDGVVDRSSDDVGLALLRHEEPEHQLQEHGGGKRHVLGRSRHEDAAHACEREERSDGRVRSRSL